MITLISKDDHTFQFDKKMLLEKCRYFQKEENLQKQDDRFLKTDTYLFDRFTSSTFIKLNLYITSYAKNLHCQDLYILADYLGFDELIYDYNYFKEIEPIWNIVHDLLVGKEPDYMEKHFPYTRKSKYSMKNIMLCNLIKTIDKIYRGKLKQYKRYLMEYFYETFDNNICSKLFDRLCGGEDEMIIKDEAIDTVFILFSRKLKMYYLGFEKKV